MQVKFVDGIAKYDKNFLILPECTCNFYPYLGVVFIHIPKTGGTALSLSLAWEDFLMQISGSEKHWNIPEIQVHRHAKISDFIKLVPENIWQNSVKFCLVRNPWETMLSSYMWFNQIAPKSVTNPRLKPLVDTVNQLTFDEFINSDLGRRHINWEVGEMWQYFQLKKGFDAVDFVSKLEDGDALNILGDRLNIEFRKPFLKHNATVHEHYKQYYSEASQNIVFDRFRYEIERFDYTF